MLYKWSPSQRRQLHREGLFSASLHATVKLQSQAPALTSIRRLFTHRGKQAFRIFYRALVARPDGLRPNGFTLQSLWRRGFESQHCYTSANLLNHLIGADTLTSHREESIRKFTQEFLHRYLSIWIVLLNFLFNKDSYQEYLSLSEHTITQHH